MATPIDEIVKQIHSLPMVDVQKVREILNKEAEEREKKRVSNAELSRKIRGKYAHLQTSSDAFANRKQSEIKKER